jgi:hypothetical protein
MAARSLHRRGARGLSRCCGSLFDAIISKPRSSCYWESDDQVHHRADDERDEEQAVKEVGGVAVGVVGGRTSAALLVGGRADLRLVLVMGDLNGPDSALVLCDCV